MPARFLVTGATGSIGTKVTAALLDNGYLVRGQYARRPGPQSRVEWRQADFCESLAFDRLVEGCDGIIHLAGEVADPQRMQRINVDATGALVEAAARNGVSYFAHASSMVVYGSARTREIDELTPIIDPLLPLQPQFFAPPTTLEYARTKAAAEFVARHAAPHLNLDILRITKSAGFARLLESLHWGRLRRMMFLYGKTHYIFDEDCAQAIVHLARRGLKRAGTPVEIYNIGDASAGTYLKLLRRAEKRLHRNPLGVHFHVPFLLEYARTAIQYKTSAFRYPSGMTAINTKKLLSTGFSLPVGYDQAVELALNEYSAS
jgi:nucleoside-diphosphate-sugar epimerase